MALTERKAIDQITVTENGVVFCRETTIIERDGVQVAKTYHRMSLTPGADVSDQPESVRDICAAAWTPAVVDAYQARALEAIERSA